jgi:putative ATPase
MDLDLFQQNQDLMTAPLAAQLRPKSLAEFLGQKKFLKKYEAILKQFQQGHILSLILWGPPGCGKTSFVKALVPTLTHIHYIEENAIDLGSKRLKEIGETARYQRKARNESTLLFIDEIHRLNRSQQDVLLPFVESGDISLIGASTENPSYELNSALMSRCRLIVFEALDHEALLALANRASESLQVPISDLFDEAFLETLISSAAGDGRRLLNTIEEAHLLYKEQKGKFPLGATDFEDFNFGQGVRYDKDRDEHHDTISAFIKSMRGSDPDAAIYYLARMLEGGEDPTFIARRIVILASEDIGNADPQALQVATAAFRAVEMIGLPEARITLAQAVTYMACAPKSNRSYLAINKAQARVKETGNLPIPLSLRSSQTKLAKSIGYGKDYKYSHEGEKAYVSQQFLPDQIKDEKFYEPSERGFEKRLKEYLAWMKNEK